MSLSWNLQSSHASLEGPHLAASIDLKYPTRGLRLGRLGIQHDVGQLWQISSGLQTDDLPLTESYLRGDDLFAIYEQTEGFPFRTQLNWRILPSDSHSPVALALIISLQTDLLDTHPELQVSTSLRCQALCRIRAREAGDSTRGRSTDSESGDQPCGVIYRFLDESLSYFEAVHPSDYCTLSLTETPSLATTDWKLFSHFLEKGVIRRARLLGTLLPHDADEVTACRALQQFADSEPPLTQ